MLTVGRYAQGYMSLKTTLLRYHRLIHGQIISTSAALWRSINAYAVSLSPAGCLSLPTHSVDTYSALSEQSPHPHPGITSSMAEVVHEISALKAVIPATRQRAGGVSAKGRKKNSTSSYRERERRARAFSTAALLVRGLKTAAARQRTMILTMTLRCQSREKRTGSTSCVCPPPPRENGDPTPSVTSTKFKRLTRYHRIQITCESEIVADLLQLKGKI
jgi:hypothetical protein